MSTDIHTQLVLRPEHLKVLQAFDGGRVIGAAICRDGRFDPVGFSLYGRLEVMANLGLVEFLARDGKRDVPPGSVTLYYYLTDRGRDLVRWRVGAPAAAAGSAPVAVRCGYESHGPSIGR